MLLLSMASSEQTTHYESLQLAVDAAGVGTWDLTPATGELVWSARCKEIFGLPPTAEITYDVFLAGLHPDDRPATQAAVEEALNPTGSGQYDIEYRTIGPQAGTPLRWARATGRTFFNEDRTQALRFIGTITDITSRKQSTQLLYDTETALRQREADFSTMANSIPQLGWMAEPNGYIFWYNQQWYAYTGTSLEEMQGWGWSQVHHPDHVDRVVDFVSKAWATGQPWELSFPLKGRDGEYRWFLTRAVPVRNEQGEVTRWFGTNTDVTAMRQLQDQLESSYQDLELKVTFRNLQLEREVQELRAQLGKA